MESDPHLFSINVSTWPKWCILLITSLGIFSSFLLHGLAHEKLYSSYNFTETIFLTACQFTGYAILALPTLIKLIRKQTQLHASFTIYFITSASLQLSMCLANFAALRLSYATEVLFKSAKLIPVLIGNVIFLHKKPKLLEVASVVLLVIGLAGISLGDIRGHNKFDTAGIIAVLSALSLDAISSNMEDKCMHEYNSSQSELIAMVYGIGAITIGIVSIITGQMQSGVKKCIENPIAILYIILFALLGSIGIQFVYLTMNVFGSLVTVMLTSLRKAATVCLSFLVFPDKKFTQAHGIAIFILACGMGLNIFGKNRKSKVQQESKEEQEIDYDEDSSSFLNTDEEKLVSLDPNELDQLDYEKSLSENNVPRSSSSFERL
jgi:adenosine 3'-phospho 5'-phosphosulfate transporter B3